MFVIIKMRAAKQKQVLFKIESVEEFQKKLEPENKKLTSKYCPLIC